MNLNSCMSGLLNIAKKAPSYAWSAVKKPDVYVPLALGAATYGAQALGGASEDLRHVHYPLLNLAAYGGLVNMAESYAGRGLSPWEKGVIAAVAALGIPPLSEIWEDKGIYLTEKMRFLLEGLRNPEFEGKGSMKDALISMGTTAAAIGAKEYVGNAIRRFRKKKIIL